jgi:hypothetical protein
MGEEQRLYKYRSVSGPSKQYTKSAICDQQIYFPPPSAFNDPFECRSVVDLSCTDDQWAKLQASALQKVNPKLSASNALKLARRFPKPSDVERLRIEKELRRHVVDELEKDAGIFCLSRRHDDILMWSHYADCHRGVCLEFSARSDPSFFAEAQAVLYQEDYPRYNHFSATKKEKAEKAFLTKSKHWEYEQELRIVDLTKGPGVQRYPSELLTGVILGCAITGVDENEVRSWVASLGHTVSMRRAVREDERFALRIEPA